MRYYTPAFAKFNPESRTNWGSCFAWRKQEDEISKKAIKEAEKYCVNTYETKWFVYKKYIVEGHKSYYKFEKERR